MIRQQCQRMENLLRDFLRFARMRDLEMTPGSLNEQVEPSCVSSNRSSTRAALRLSTTSIPIYRASCYIATRCRQRLSTW